jgi:hypothetical protein
MYVFEGLFNLVRNLRLNFFFFFYMSTQGKGERGFELVTSASLGVVHSRLI